MRSSASRHGQQSALHVIHIQCVHYVHVQHGFDFYATECWIRVCVHYWLLLLQHSCICGGGLCQCFL